MTEYIVEPNCSEFGCGCEVKEEIVRCKDCKKQLPKGWRFAKYFNEAEQEACRIFSNHDFDFEYTSFFYVEPDDFCKWGEPKVVE